MELLDAQCTGPFGRIVDQSGSGTLGALALVVGRDVNYVRIGLPYEPEEEHAP